MDRQQREVALRNASAARGQKVFESNSGINGHTPFAGTIRQWKISGRSLDPSDEPRDDRCRRRNQSILNT